MRRVLSLWQPHATLTVGFNGAGTTPPMPAKQFETRHFRPRHPLPIDVVIHAAKRWNRDEAERIRMWPFSDALKRANYSQRDPSKDYTFNGSREYNSDYTAQLTAPRRLPLGALIGVATIVRVERTEDLLASWDGRTGAEYRRVAEEAEFGNYEAGRFGWELANAIELPEPIPFRGRQDVLYELDESINAQIDEQLAAVRP